MIATVGVIGAGTMGGGIAGVAARAGLDVILHDSVPSALTAAIERIGNDLRSGAARGKRSAEEAAGALARVRSCSSLHDLASAGIVIEAAVEDLDVKQAIVRALDQIVSPSAIIATNTSSLSITAIASVCRNPETVVGMHFFNPPAAMQLVEVVRGHRTSDETAMTVRDLATRFGKIPVICSDTPGFIVNRVARPFYGEALRLLAEGVGSVEQIDAILTRSGGFRMGPFALMDLIGIDVNYAVSRSVYEQFFHEPRFRPHPIQRRMVEAGVLGRKTGKGFYTYK